MAKFRDLLGGIMREKIGMQQKLETYNNKLSAYDSVINGVNEIEQEAIAALKNESIDMYVIITAKQKRLETQYTNGKVANNDYVFAKNLLQEQLDNIVASYVDTMQNYTIRIQRDKLIRIQRNYMHLAGFDMMDFDTFENMKLSREVAKNVKDSLQNGSDYERAKEVAESIWRYRRDNHMRRG